MDWPKLIDAVRKNLQIESLCIKRLSSWPTTIQQIVKTLGFQTAIKHLTIHKPTKDNDSIFRHSTQFLCLFIEANKSLESLHIDCIDCGPEIEKILYRSTSLKSINIGPFQTHTFKMFRYIEARNRALLWLRRRCIDLAVVFSNRKIPIYVLVDIIFAEFDMCCWFFDKTRKKENSSHINYDNCIVSYRCHQSCHKNALLHDRADFERHRNNVEFRMAQKIDKIYKFNCQQNLQTRANIKRMKNK